MKSDYFLNLYKNNLTFRTLLKGKMFKDKSFIQDKTIKSIYIIVFDKTYKNKI